MSFLKEKPDTIEFLESLVTRIKVKIGHPIERIRSDREKEFDNVDIDLFCGSKVIKHEFSVLRPPQQNGMVERKNRVS